jgi:hypothetical protein
VDRRRGEVSPGEVARGESERRTAVAPHGAILSRGCLVTTSRRSSLVSSLR